MDGEQNFQLTCFGTSQLGTYLGDDTFPGKECFRLGLNSENRPWNDHETIISNQSRWAVAWYSWRFCPLPRWHAFRGPLSVEPPNPIEIGKNRWESSENEKSFGEKNVRLCGFAWASKQNESSSHFYPPFHASLVSKRYKHIKTGMAFGIGSDQMEDWELPNEKWTSALVPETGRPGDWVTALSMTHPVRAWKIIWQVGRKKQRTGRESGWETGSMWFWESNTSHGEMVWRKSTARMKPQRDRVLVAWWGARVTRAYSLDIVRYHYIFCNLDLDWKQECRYIYFGDDGSSWRRCRLGWDETTVEPPHKAIKGHEV